MYKFTHIRHALLAATAIAGLVAAVAPSHAALIETYTAGEWKGEVYTNDQTGAFSHCFASAQFQNGLILGVALNARNAWSMVLAYPNWKLDRGGNFNIRLAIDNTPALETFGLAVSAQTIEFALDGAQDILTRIVQSSRIDVSASTVSYRFDVTKMGETLIAVRDCAQRHGVQVADGQRAAPANAPPQPQPTGTPMQPQPAATPRQPLLAPQVAPQRPATPTTF
jgi:hypothetical protein